MNYLKSIVLFGFLLLMISSCSNVQIPGKWKSNEIKIDGNSQEWENNLYYFKNEELLFGSYNDDKNLYICFTTSRTDIINRAIGMGLILWIDFDGGDDKTLGIEFPQGLSELKNNIRENSDFTSVEMRNKMRNSDINEKLDLLKDKLDKIVLVKNDPEEKRTIYLKQNTDFESSINYNDGIFVYELCIPLTYSINTNDKFSFQIDTGQVIGLGLETGSIKFDKKNRDRNATEGMFPDGGSGPDGGFEPGMGGMPKGGGMQPGGMGRFGGRSGKRSSIPEKLSFWVDIKIASFVK